MSEQIPPIVPMLAYEDGAAAIDWLTNAFGFREQLRYTEEDGRISHAQLELSGGMIMLGTPSPHYQSPKRHRESCAAARKWNESPYVIDGVHVYVDDIESHYARAKEAGARLLSGIEDAPHGDRLYRVEDAEGHRWMFAEHVRDVPVDTWGGVEAQRA
jgi:uncharacterized glyoxalase superfamily protein PhnB